ncbi:peptidylprolyl isomerase [Patescibacteria group bacterium]|nr:peptidylprolyl isomerase [Patescibacteria group bacterium]
MKKNNDNTGAFAPDNTSPSPTGAAALKDPPDAVSAKVVTLKTDMGDIKINLYPADAPKTVENFVTLGKRGYYNGIIFHRVIKAFVIQAGDPAGTGTGGTSIFGAEFPDEINSHKIVKGTVAMANKGPNTNSSQFFIVTESAQPSLDGHYTVFGQVADNASQAVVEKIAAVPTDSSDKPTQPIKITGFQIDQR